MPKITAITAVAPYHRDLITRCADSVSMQTVPCDHIIIEDTDYRGAGWARNRGIEKSKGDFLIFLDSDDRIEPNFVERCLDVWKPGAYVYTDWLTGDLYRPAPEKPWRADGSWHVITALLPRQAVIDVDGFDEELPAGEDSLLYWQLTRNGCCGIHLPEPLFHYGHEGQRAKIIADNKLVHDEWRRKLLGRFGKQLGCCGDPTENPPDVPSNEGLPGDILARAIWGGNRQAYGLVTRRDYGRTGNGKLVKIDPRDAKAEPHLWQVVIEPAAEPKRLNIANENGKKPAAMPPLVKPMRSIQEVAVQLFDAQLPVNVDEMLTIEPVGKPDVKRVLGLVRL